MHITEVHKLVNCEQDLKSKKTVAEWSVQVCVFYNTFQRWHLTAQGKCISLTSTTALVCRTENTRSTKQNSFILQNTPVTFTPSLLDMKQDSFPIPHWNLGYIFAYKIDSYVSAPDLKCSEGLRVHIVPVLCTEGEKKKRRRWWGLDWTHSNWWVPWPEGWVCMCLYVVCACTCTLCRLNHCNGALMSEQLNGREHSQKIAPLRKIIWRQITFMCGHHGQRGILFIS